MGALSFTINAIQSGQIDELQEEVASLTKRIEILEDWIRYLTSENYKYNSTHGDHHEVPTSSTDPRV